MQSVCVYEIIQGISITDNRIWITSGSRGHRRELQESRKDTEISNYKSIGVFQ